LKLDEGTGTTTADASGNGNTGTLINGTAWAAGTSGQGVALDGVDDYVLIPHSAILDTFPSPGITRTPRTTCKTTAVAP
jgi:hypothetical protein